MNNITYKNLKRYSYKFNKKNTNKVLKNVNTKSNFKNLILKNYNKFRCKCIKRINFIFNLKPLQKKGFFI